MGKEDKTCFSSHSEDEIWYKANRGKIETVKLPQAQFLIRQALDHIRGDLGKALVAFSGGKDSVVLAHIINTMYPVIGMSWQDSGTEHPETRAIVRHCKETLGWNIHITTPVIDVEEAIRRENEGERKAKVYWCIEKPRWELWDTLGIELVFTGIRKEESKARKINYHMRGPINYSKRERVWICTPLIHWKWQEIFGYIWKHKLPLHPLYNNPRLMRLVGNRGMIRVNNTSDRELFQLGTAAQLRASAPLEYERIRNLIPEIKDYT